MILRFELLPQSFALVRLPPDSPLPAWASVGAFSSVTRTQDELSIICEETRVPAELEAESGWRCLKLHGPLALTEVGIAAEFTSNLARSSISVLVVSTFDTDYALVPGADVERAIRSLERGGHRVSR